MNHLTRIAFVFALSSVALACSGSEDADDSNTQGQGQTNALTCVAGQPHPCACLGQATMMGMQSCNATGNGYGACMGCPPPPSSSGGNSAAVAGHSGAGGTPANNTPDAGKKDPTPIPDAGKADASMHEDSSVSLPSGAEPGVSCGVGLPALCDLETEKCCVRSLQTDSCIAADAMCSCPLTGCTVMEARCDGPEDCMTGQVCCGTLANSGNGYQNFVCAATCQSTGNQRQACHDDGAPCPQGLSCANSQLLTNVKICIDLTSIDQ